MPNSESVIIKPDHVFDFDLLYKIIPGVRVGERFMRLDTIEEVSYQEVTEKLEGITKPVTSIQLGVAHASGSIYFFSDSEARELEEQIKAAVKKAELQQTNQLEQQRELMAQAAQEALRRESQAIIPGNVKTGWIPGMKRR